MAGLAISLKLPFTPANDTIKQEIDLLSQRMRLYSANLSCYSLVNRDSKDSHSSKED